MDAHIGDKVQGSVQDCFTQLTSVPGRHILQNYTCIFGVYGVCRVYTKNTQNTPCISGVFLEVAFKERVKLVYITSDVYLV